MLFPSLAPSSCSVRLLQELRAYCAANFPPKVFPKDRVTSRHAGGRNFVSYVTSIASTHCVRPRNRLKKSPMRLAKPYLSTSNSCPCQPRRLRTSARELLPILLARRRALCRARCERWDCCGSALPSPNPAACRRKTSLAPEMTVLPRTIPECVLLHPSCEMFQGSSTWNPRTVQDHQAWCATPL